MTSVFIEPCDILFFRDDLPFGAAGNQVARSQFPPRPSVVAGALRTRVLVDQGVDFDAFAHGASLPEVVGREIGRVHVGARPRAVEPGTFTLAALDLGHVNGDHRRRLYRAGRDLVAGGKRGTDLRRRRVLGPAVSARVPGVSSLAPLVAVGIVPDMTPVSGWLEAHDHARYLAGDAPERIWREGDLLDWDHRVGIGMEPGARTVDEGRLYSSWGVVLRDGWGFVASVEGCSLLPTAGLVRLGGDGRMARLAPWPSDEPDWSTARRAVVSTGRFRWVLQTPAIFANGWRPAAVREESGAFVFERDGLRARLVSAAIAPAELAGGWDLVNRGPKPFRLMAPAGSVYWFEVVSGSGEDAWRMFHGRSVSDEKANEGFGIVHVGGWPNV